jgi:hypothetical protein
MYQFVTICLVVMSFWFSEKQDSIGKPSRSYFKRLDGKIIRYTECTNKGKKPSSFKDMKYLGDGVFYKTADNLGDFGNRN